MIEETLIEKLRGYKSTPRHCEELCYEAAIEIESLRQQLAEAYRNIKIANSQTEEFERKWYLAKDALEDSQKHRRETLDGSHFADIR